MGWKERFRQARFRSATFFVEAADSEFGRRTVEHEFPQQDRPLSQDLGRAARKFTIEGYLLGDGYLEQRDLLLKECETKGPGELIHPYFGSLSVICKSVKFRDAMRETRIVRVSLDFVEANIDFAYPIRIPDPSQRVLSFRERVLTAANAAFQKVYSIARKPFIVVQNVNQTLDSALSLVGTARRTVGTASDFQRELENALEKTAQLVFAPVELAQMMIDLLTFGTGEGEALSDGRQKLDEFLDLFAFAPAKEFGEGDPSVAVKNLVRQASTAAAAGLTIEIEYDSLNDAVFVRDIVLNQINAVTEVIGVDDELYAEFQDLREAVVRVIDEKASNLAQLATYTPAFSMPALVLSNALYSTTDQEADILKRNRVRHPGFIPGGKDVEVLISVE